MGAVVVRVVAVEDVRVLGAGSDVPEQEAQASSAAVAATVARGGCPRMRPTVERRVRKMRHPR